METLVKKRENLRKNNEESESFRSIGVGNASLTDSSAISRESSSSRSSSEISSKDVKTKSCSSPPQLGWPIRKAHLSRTSIPEKREGEKMTILKDSKTNKLDSEVSELDMMKERFSKLLLGEDMSGSGKGVYSALAISNAITNLSATIFGQLWRLEPLSEEKKSMWRREMDWLLCVSDHIVELIPSCQTFPDGTKLEVMTCRPRSDLFVNLPALCKLDNMLIELLDTFTDTEFWYVDQGIIASEGNGSASFRKSIQRQEEKWWLPVPRVPPGGLSETSRKHLNHRRECVGQILKAAMAINSISLAEMEVPQSYLEDLPKNGRSCLRDTIYRYITSDQFSPDRLLDSLDLSSEHIALEIANRVEAAIHVWRRRGHSKPQTNPSRVITKSSWEVVKDLVIDGDKRALLAERAESLLLCLKQRFPALTQSTLDTSKIQSNKDVGKSILESYSRVLESLASNIIARIEDLLYVDDLTARSGRLSAISTVNVVAHKKKISYPFSGAVSSSPFKSSSATPSFSPMPLVSPSRGERTPFIANKNNCKLYRRGLGVKRVLTNYLGVETKPKIFGNLVEGSGHVINDNAKEVVERQKNSSAGQNGSKLPQN